MGAAREVSVTKTLVEKIRERGLRGVAAALNRRGRRLLYTVRSFGAEEYRGPSDAELEAIEQDLLSKGIPVESYSADTAAFARFRRQIPFPPDYHGGIEGGVYEEKLLEHFVAWELLGLSRGQRYLDVAGATSPWAHLLNDQGVEAYAVDLYFSPDLAARGCYVIADATSTPFPTGFLDAASAQCAYEMFEGDSDIRLLAEISRLLRPGGKFVVLPLYMHTHPCYYQTPDYWGAHRGDPGAKAYVRRDTWGVPASRKYSAETLYSRVIHNARKVGLGPRVLVLRNKREFGADIYLHFILVLDKAGSASEE
jgi:SAM-dependent methyltransferase